MAHEFRPRFISPSFIFAFCFIAPSPRLQYRGGHARGDDCGNGRRRDDTSRLGLSWQATQIFPFKPLETHAFSRENAERCSPASSEANTGSRERGHCRTETAVHQWSALFVF